MKDFIEIDIGLESRAMEEKLENSSVGGNSVNGFS